MTNEWAIVPMQGRLYKSAARTLLVLWNPPRIAYRLAKIPPQGPYALRRPNSANFDFSPAAILILINNIYEIKWYYLLAFVAIREGKFTRFNIVVSSS